MTQMYSSDVKVLQNDGNSLNDRYPSPPKGCHVEIVVVKPPVIQSPTAETAASNEHQPVA